MAYIWEILAATGTILVFWYGYYGKKSYLPAYLAGMAYGLFWEIATEPLFNYTGAFNVFIWKDIPLAIIIGWGASIAGFQILSDFVHSKYKIKFNTLKSLAADALVAGLFGFAMEYLGSHNLVMWTYPATSLPLIAGMPVIWIIGWVMSGLLNLSLARRLDAALNISKI
ncbi:MAG: hypothetical protein V1839_01605 [archaeon]